MKQSVEIEAVCNKINGRLQNLKQEMRSKKQDQENLWISGFIEGLVQAQNLLDWEINPDTSGDMPG